MADFLKRGALYLAPMSGYTDAAFREIAMENGADVCVSEFVHARAVLSKAPKVLEKLRIDVLARPCGIQLFGGDEFEMADAASFVEEYAKPDFIDINYGCPAPNAVDAGAGSALLKNVPKMAEIAKKVKGALKKIPLTAKMRTGWGAESVLPRAALELEEAGVEVLAIHGRSKNQGYKGDADWALIEETANCLKIPVIGNGSAEKLTASELQESACFGFMVGRAAVGNPWIFKEIKAGLNGEDFIPPTANERVETALKYLEKSLQNQGDDSLKAIRANLIAFMRGHGGFKKMRLALANSKTIEDVYMVFKGFLNG